MATRFEPIALGEPTVSGIRLHGAFGRGDRQRLMNLADRCIQKQKRRLVIDCSDLDSLGGGGAAALADLQGRLLERDGEMVFVGAGEVVLRFLRSKFANLPLRCFETVAAALTALGVASPPESGPATAADKTTAAAAPPDERGADLDRLLEKVQPEGERPDPLVRRTADLVTAAYVSLEDVLQAAHDGSNPPVIGEALSQLLDSHDLAAETIYCHAHGHQYQAASGKVRLPAAGGVVAGLLRIKRPLTLLDLEDGELWDEESALLEELQPDLILPLICRDELTGIAFLRRGGEEREYGICEIFALELLLRLWSQPVSRASADTPASGEAVLSCQADRRQPPGRKSARAASEERAEAAGLVTVPQPVSSQENLLGVRLELTRGLQDAQDLPHFWQVVISRLREVAEVTSLAYLDGADRWSAGYLAGEARRGLVPAELTGERLLAFFRTLERPIEVVNMPSSLGKARNLLLGCGLHWLAPLRAEGSQYLGVVALGLRWRFRLAEPCDEIHGFLEIAGEALLRLRENQNRADMSLGLFEDLLVGREMSAQPVDEVTRETARTVRLLARELGLSSDQEQDLVLGALLRNHGQIDPTLDDLAADQLTGQKWEMFRSHPDNGEQRLAQLKAPAAVRDAVRHHHERFDGRGFPLGLRGRDIPLAARLVALAQCHALHLVRSGGDQALAAVKQEAGRALDPDLVEIFVKAAVRDQATITVQA